MADVDIDNDTLTAIRAMWDRVPGLPGVVASLPHAGKGKSTKEDELAIPYAHISSQPNAAERGFGYTLDRRMATISIYGTKAQASQALTLAMSVFHSRMGLPGSGNLSIEYPSGARFVSWIPQSGNGALSQTEAVRNGEDIWLAKIEAIVTSVRSG